MANNLTPFFQAPHIPRTYRPNFPSISKGYQHGVDQHIVHKSRRAKGTIALTLPQPDGPAVNMLALALSSPGICVVASFLAASVALLIPNVDENSSPATEDTSSSSLPEQERQPFDTIATPPSSGVVFYLHLSLHTSCVAECPDGCSRLLKKGNAILRFPSMEHCEAVARPLRPFATSYVVYTLDGISMRTLSKWPRKINRTQPSPPNSPETPDCTTAFDDVMDPAAVWAQYETLGEFGELDRKWRAFMDSQPSIILTSANGGPIGNDAAAAPCRLCGGTGTTRCFRCGGAASFARIPSKCDCDRGRRACEWCSSHL